MTDTPLALTVFHASLLSTPCVVIETFETKPKSLTHEGSFAFGTLREGDPLRRREGTQSCSLDPSQMIAVPATE